MDIKTNLSKAVGFCFIAKHLLSSQIKGLLRDSYKFNNVRLRKLHSR